MNKLNENFLHMNDNIIIILLSHYYYIKNWKKMNFNKDVKIKLRLITETIDSLFSDTVADKKRFSRIIDFTEANRQRERSKYPY